MMSNIWNKISYLGIKSNEINDKREVILLNKSVFITLILIILFIPFEIILNGFTLVPFEIIAALVFASVLFFNAKRWFNLAKYYTIIIGTALILFSTYAVGGHSNSEFNLLPIMLFPLLFFRKKTHIIPLTLFVVCSFYVLKFTVDVVPPLMDVPLKVRVKVQPIMNFMTMIFLFAELYYFKKINETYESQLKKQQDEINEKHQEILDSINYAERIQKALLDNQEHWDSISEHFILFKPRDVVSGDFYWAYSFFTQSKNDVTLSLSKSKSEELSVLRQAQDDNSEFVVWAAADCTGHGVPGAFMSMLGVGFLNEIVAEGGETDAANILNKLRAKIIKALEQKGSTSEQKDGMDIALCVWNKTTNTLQYAGANNPLVIIRGAGIIEFKGDKMPIGKHLLHDRNFTAHEIQLQKGDVIYTFTDGFQDQFGGEQGKKYMVKRMKEFLKINAHLPMQEQHELLNQEIEHWMKIGKTEQIDDICLIGVRL